MTIPITLFLVQVTNNVPEMSTELPTLATQYQQIKQAVLDYSRIKPDTVTVDLTGDGGKYYAINTTNFPGYGDGFSRISSIEYPAYAVSSDQTPVYLDAEDWDEEYYDASNVRYLFLPHHAPAATETMRIRFNGLYTWTVGSLTTSVTQAAHGFSVNDYVYLNSANVWVSAGSSASLLATHQVSAVGSSSTFTAKTLEANTPEADFFTICNRAACLICQAIAAKYSRTNDTTITLDSVNHTTRASEFGRRAKEFCEKWESAMGIGKAAKDAGYLPASEWVDFDVQPGFPGSRQYIFHYD